MSRRASPRSTSRTANHRVVSAIPSTGNRRALCNRRRTSPGALPVCLPNKFEFQRTQKDEIEHRPPNLRLLDRPALCTAVWLMRLSLFTIKLAIKFCTKHSERTANTVSLRHCFPMLFPLPFATRRSSSTQLCATLRVFKTSQTVESIAAGTFDFFVRLFVFVFDVVLGQR